MRCELFKFIFRKRLTLTIWFLECGTRKIIVLGQKTSKIMNSEKYTFMANHARGAAYSFANKMTSENHQISKKTPGSTIWFLEYGIRKIIVLRKLQKHEFCKTPHSWVVSCSNSFFRKKNDFLNTSTEIKENT